MEGHLLPNLYLYDAVRSSTWHYMVVRSIPYKGIENKRGGVFNDRVRSSTEYIQVLRTKY